MQEQPERGVAAWFCHFNDGTSAPPLFCAQVKQAEEEERRAREDMKKQKEAEKKDREFAPQGVASELGADEEVIKLMGFGSFA